MDKTIEQLFSEHSALMHAAEWTSDRIRALDRRLDQLSENRRRMLEAASSIYGLIREKQGIAAAQSLAEKGSTHAE